MQPISEGQRPEPTTAGAWLKQARQQRGLHIAALAVMLKVPQAKLEALEADRYDELPDATFARALATAMCRALKVDAAPVLALLPSARTSEFDVRPGLNQPFRERGGPIDGGVLALLGRPVVWGLALLLVAAAAIYWLPAGWLPERDAVLATPVPAASAVPAAASAAAPEFVPAPAAAAEPAASAVVAAAAPVAAAPASSTPPPTAVAQAASAPSVAPAIAPGQALRISTSADSWVEISDAKGQIVLSRVLRTGEHQEFGGAAPYKLRIGNVEGTRVEWRGAAVDLAASAANNVARLELN